jgi:hypothetical protein
MVVALDLGFFQYPKILEILVNECPPPGRLTPTYLRLALPAVKKDVDLFVGVASVGNVQNRSDGGLRTRSKS